MEVLVTVTGGVLAYTWLALYIANVLCQCTPICWQNISAWWL